MEEEEFLFVAFDPLLRIKIRELELGRYAESENWPRGHKGIVDQMSILMAARRESRNLRERKTCSPVRFLKQENSLQRRVR
jgi:hypothetical protein